MLRNFVTYVRISSLLPVVQPMHSATDPSPSLSSLPQYNLAQKAVEGGDMTYARVRDETGDLTYALSQMKFEVSP